jgi:hypothetical protein
LTHSKRFTYNYCFKNVRKKLIYSCFPRYLYGREKEFENASFGAEVYKFAHEMQIDSLTEDLGKFFEGTEASEIFAIFDLYLRLDGNQTVLETCKQVIILMKINWEP